MFLRHIEKIECISYGNIVRLINVVVLLIGMVVRGRSRGLQTTFRV